MIKKLKAESINFIFYNILIILISVPISFILADNTSLNNDNANAGNLQVRTLPELFYFEQSTAQAFYYFENALDISGNPIDSTDWVAAFNGEVCVGARKWDVIACGGICDVPVMGYDGEDLTNGYMLPGDVPSFKIYDSSEDVYYDAIPSQFNSWANFAFFMEDQLNSVILGCTDSSAENFNSDATIDDGSCDFGLPELFIFQQSIQQAFYFAYAAFDINGNSLEANDWVAAFNGSVCVGARKWDLSQCQGGVCDIPVMGDDGSIETSGYMQSGDIPSFKIYDASENTYLDAVPTQNYPWTNFDMVFIDEIQATNLEFLSIPLHKDNNLVSFYILPSETSVVSVVEDIQSSILAVVGEGVSTQYILDDDVWIGSLTDFDTYSGYWLYMGDSIDTLNVAGVGIDPNKEYQLQEGTNLISFPVPGSVGISDGIPDEIESLIPYVISEGVATAQVNGEWVGSLESFDGGRGYWVNVSEPINFQYELENLTVLNRSNHLSSVTNNTNFFNFAQSKTQSFYFINLEKISDVQNGDWILAYNNDVLIGSRQWFGGYVDVPVMGYDGSWNTIGYAELNDKISFEVFTNGKRVKLKMKDDIFRPNEVNIINSLDIDGNSLVADFELSSVYPNPFNPETTISFSLLKEYDVNLNVYDANGRFLETIISDSFKSGNYKVNWNGDSYPSGIYFIKLSILNHEQTKKVMLIK